MADTKISGLTELTVPPDPTDELVVVDKSDTSMAASGTDKRLQYSNLYDWAEAGDLSTIQPDDAAAAGTSVEIPRADHKHAIVAATAGVIEPDDAAAEGSATSFARSDHKHSIVAATAATLTGTNAEGTSTSFARADHNHALPAWGTIPTYVPLAAPASATFGVNATYFALAQRVLSASTITGVEMKNGGAVSGTLNMRAQLYDSSLAKVAETTSSITQSGTNVRQRFPFSATYLAAPGLYYALIWSGASGSTAFMAPVLGSVGGTGTNASPGAMTTFSLSDLSATSVPMMQLY